VAHERRTLLGITGPPGAGKSTLARAIVGEVGDKARLIEMDGFHLAQSRLAELGRLERKGAIDTYDGNGFLALIQRMRNSAAETIYAPQFRREFEESIAGAIAVEPRVRLVVVEGNYLLVETGPWGELRGLFDEVWFCESEENARLLRLIDRHRSYGKTEAEARHWALGPDQRNADVVASTRSRADVIISIPGRLPIDEGAAVHAGPIEAAND